MWVLQFTIGIIRIWKLEKYKVKIKVKVKVKVKVKIKLINTYLVIARCTVQLVDEPDGQSDLPRS